MHGTYCEIDNSNELHVYNVTMCSWINTLYCGQHKTNPETRYARVYIETQTYNKIINDFSHDIHGTKVFTWDKAENQ